ncbi:MAG TPA: CHAT domain-containing protein [Pyrinomonadaceae bacterium]|jgi:hypothetical protein
MNSIENNHYGNELRITLTLNRDSSEPNSSSNTFLLHAESLAGEVSASSFRPPFSTRDIVNALTSIPRAVDEFQSSFGPPREIIRSLGERLFTSLCEGRVGKLYLQSLEMVKVYNQSLRVTIIIDDSELAVLPWEFLYDPLRKDFIALSVRSPIIRRWSSPEEPYLSPLALPLNVLIISAEVHKYDLGTAESEIKIIEECLSGGEFKISRLPNATPSQFMRALASEEPIHALHFIARGVPSNYEANSAYAVSSESVSLSQLGLLLHSDSKGVHSTDGLVDLSLLKHLIRSMRDLRFVSLSGDHTDWIACQLAKECPAVLGWRGENTFQAYESFSRGFYSAFRQFQPLEAAVTQGRQAIDLDYPGGKEWGMPVFYMQVNDGKLFAGAGGGAEQSAMKSIDHSDFESLSLTDTGNAAPARKEKKDSSRKGQKISALIEMENENLLAIQTELSKFGADAPEFLVVQKQEIQNKIELLRSELEQLD